MKARNSMGMAAAALMAMAVSGPAMADGPNGADMEWTLAHKLNTTTVSHALRSTYSSPTLLVVQSSCQWQAAMAALSASNSLAYGAESEPAVDWKNQSVVVVAMGQVPYGYDLTVREARQSQGKLLLDVRVDYQSYENNLDDENPVAVLVVDGHGMNKVHAMYSLELPTLVSRSDAPSCGAAHAGPDLGSSDGSDPVQTAATWGSLKALYR